MDTPSLSIFRHALSACPCGHSSHIGRTSALPGKPLANVIECEACDAIVAEAEDRQWSGAFLTIVSCETVDTLALNVGTSVRYSGRMMEIVELEQIMKLGGHLPTGYVRVLMWEEK